MPKDILLKPGKRLRDDDTHGIEYDSKEIIDEIDQQALLISLHSHSNKAILDLITAAGSGEVITSSERAKLASIDATHYGSPLQTTVELSAIPEANITDKERRYIEDELSDYFYDATWPGGGTAPEVAPDDQTGGTGFWRQVRNDGETAASIKTKYESNANTNEFNDAEKSKLAGITNIGSGLIMTADERSLLNATHTTEYHLVTAGDVAAGFFTLAHNPVSYSEVKVYDVDGIMQVSYIGEGWSGVVTPDFTVSNTNQLHINNTIAVGLSESIIAGDILAISYRYV